MRTWHDSCGKWWRDALAWKSRGQHSVAAPTSSLALGVEMTAEPSVEALVERVREAKRIRHFTIPMLKEEFGDDWPRESARVQSEADTALDSLTAAYREMEKDRDEWERRYSELLEAVGGTWPG
jgi:hypothetical protein